MTPHRHEAARTGERNEQKWHHIAISGAKRTYPVLSAAGCILSFMTTPLIELDDRISRLEEFVKNDLSVRVDAMNWAIGQTHNNTEVMRLDVAGLRVGLAHVETSLHANVAALKLALDLRTSELRHDLRAAEVSIRHDMRTFRDSVMQRFEAMDGRLEAMDGRLNGVGQRFDGLEAKTDQVLAVVRSGNGAATG